MAQVSETTTATGPCHGCRPAAADAASSTTTQAATTGAGWVPTTESAQPASGGDRQRPAAGQHRRYPARAHGHHDPGRAQRRKRQSLKNDHQHDGRHAERSGRPIAHHLQRAFGRSVAAQAVGGIGHTVDVQAAGDRQQCGHREQTGQRVTRAERQSAGPRHRRAQRAQYSADHRQRGHRTAAQRPVRSAWHRDNGLERESRCQRANHDVGERSVTLASANVAMDDSAATAARSTGRATAAPVPSPSRIFRSRIGSRPS